jgi:hypothetical protein
LQLWDKDFGLGDGDFLGEVNVPVLALNLGASAYLNVCMHVCIWAMTACEVNVPVFALKLGASAYLNVCIRVGIWELTVYEVNVPGFAWNLGACASLDVKTFDPGGDTIT